MNQIKMENYRVVSWGTSMSTSLLDKAEYTSHEIVDQITAIPSCDIPVEAIVEEIGNLFVEGIITVGRDNIVSLKVR